MVRHVDYISVREVLARVARHPLLQNIDLEAGVQYTLDFIGIMGLPNMHIDKQECVDIKDFRGVLPCDLIIINQVRDERTGLCLRSMTDNFNGASRNVNSEATFKTQGRYIYTSFPHGKVRISYQATMIDEDGIPMLPDHPVFLKALEDYIKVQYFTVLYDVGKIRQDVLSHAEQEYAWSAGKCQNSFTLLSVSEMESLTGMMHRLIPSRREFDKGFKTMGDKEHYRRHNG